MVFSAPHKNEDLRLASLISYNIIDTQDDKRFDDLTSFVAGYFNVKYCLVTFIDNERQWFKSRYGIQVPETPRELSICAHTIIEESDFLIVPNTKKDVRFHDNPFVINAPNIAFYAGAKLISQDGFPLGTLCIMDDEPRAFSDSDMKTLQMFSLHIMDMLELRKKEHSLKTTFKNLHLLEKEKKLLNSRIHSQVNGSIKQIQSSILNVLSNVEPDSEMNFELENLQLKLNGLFKEVNGIESFTAAEKHLQFEEISSSDLIESAVRKFRLQLPHAQITIQPFTNSIIAADAESLEKVVSTILNFSLSKLRPDENIDINIDINANEKRHLFSFTFPWYGLNDEEKNHINLSLASDDDYTDKLDLEMALCHKLITQHSGKFWVYSLENVGTTFFFTVKNDQNIYGN